MRLLSIRQFKRSGELLLDALSTFTATELLSYNEFIGLTVIAIALGLKRVDLKKKVRTFCIFFVPYHLALRIYSQPINAPEVDQVLPKIAVLGDLVKNLYECHYDKFFVALGVLYPSSTPLMLTIPFLTLEQTHLLYSRLLSPPGAFLHKGSVHSRVHATVRELSKSDPGQPMLSVWGRQEFGSTRECPLLTSVSSLYSVAFICFSYIVVPVPFDSRKETGIDWRTASFLIFFFFTPSKFIHSHFHMANPPQPADSPASSPQGASTPPSTKCTASWRPSIPVSRTRNMKP